jgi:hypothetical protein
MTHTVRSAWKCAPLSPTAQYMQRCTYFSSNWGCATALSYDGLARMVNCDWNRTAVRNQKEPETVHARNQLTLIWDSNHLCVNSNSVEDTDLYFMCKEFPPPSHLASSALHDDDELGAIRSANKISFALHYEACWNSIKKGAGFIPLTQTDVAYFGKTFPLLLNLEQRQRIQCWGSLEEELRNYFRSSDGSHSRVERTSTHERLELVLRGHTRRLPSRLFVSMSTVEMMKLSLVPDAQWYIYGKTENNVQRSLDSAASRQKKKQKIASDKIVSTSGDTSLEEYSFTVDELHLLGGQ